jgi:Zn-dependent M28 family amino/carboxypeptidase
METPSMQLAETQKRGPESADKDKVKSTFASPVIIVNDSIANELLAPSNKTINKLRKKYSKKRSIDPLVLRSTVLANIVFLEEQLNAENVIGYIPGSERPNEFVYITAHYDHIGVIDNEVYNGADDDGSGTVGVLELAEAFAMAKAQGQGHKRSIVFMTVAGEEKGLLGSQYYTSNPTFPINNTTCDLNIDMIGRVDNAHKKDSNYIYVIGADKISSDLHEINEKMNTEYTHLNLDYTYNSPSDPNRFYYRSDHYNFAKYNIPIIFYFNGVHEDYHKATDEIAKINFPMLSNRTKLVFYTAWEIANRAEPLRKDKKNDFENNR